MMEEITLWLPEALWSDSEELDCTENLFALHFKRGRGVEVRGPREAFIAYKRHAEHWVGPNSPDGTGYSGTKASARATIKKLDAAGI